MVAIVSGNALGLSLGSMGVLGEAKQGRGADGVFVNAVTGNVVIQAQDDLLVSRGYDATALRTYNSQGLATDDNGDNWTSGFFSQQLKLVGTRNTAGSTLTRTDRDGAQAVYAYNATTGRYESTAGSGAYDSITYDATADRYVWTDGGSGTKERYDAAATGRLLSTTDAAGNVTSYTYNTAGKLATVVDASGETTYYDYSGNNLTQIRSVLQGGATVTRVRYAYDATNRLSTVTVDLSPADNSVSDAKTYVTTYTYDGTSTRVASVTQSDGTRTSLTYVLVGSQYRVASVTDALNQVTKFAYDTTTRRTTVTDPLNLVTLLDYDSAGQLLKVTASPVGGVTQVVSYAYSANGDLTQTVDAQGNAVVMQYDASGNQTLQRDAAGNTVTRSFDARNQLITETAYVVADPDGAGSLQPSQPLTTRYVYDAAGKNQLRFVLSPEGRVTEYQYSGYGERIAVIQYPSTVYAVGALALNAVPTEAQMSTWVGTQDRTKTLRTDHAYDARGQLQRSTVYASVASTGLGVNDATASVTQYVYDQAGNLLSTVSPTTGTATRTYDGLGRVLSEKDALNQSTVSIYDDANRKTSITAANGLVTTTVQDAAGRLVSVLQSSAASANLGQTQYFYDADGRLRMTQDPTGVRQWKLYDEAGRTVAEIDGNGSLTEYVYDRNNQVTQTIAYATTVATAGLVDANGKPASVALAGLRPAANANDRKTWRVYDSANRLAKSVDEAGAVTEYGYDGASRLVKQTRYATTITTTALGSSPAATAIAPAASALDDRVNRTFFDGDGRLLGTLDGEGYLTEYQYDAVGREVVSTRYATQSPSGSWASGTLASLRPATAAGDIRSVTLYNGKGQVSGRVDGENYLTEYVYDAAGNVTTTVRYATKLAAVVAPGTAVASVRPAANAQDQAVSNVYDALDRLTQTTDAQGTVTEYKYDSVGHLVQTTRAVGQYDARTINARYDVQGRLVGELSGEGGAALAALVSPTQAQIDAVWSQYGLTHAYDAAGRRTSTVDANGFKTLFFYNVDGQLTHTVNALGEVQERQYNALGQLVASIRYGTRIASATLATLGGGLVTAGMTSAVTAIANVALDSRVGYSYYRTGALATTTDELTNVDSRNYNAFGEQVAETLALGGGQTTMNLIGRDRRGLVQVTASDVTGVNATTSAVYDAFGRVTSSTDANGNVRGTAYDRLGRVVQTVDPATIGRSSSYDAFGRVLTTTNALGQATTYAYDAAARSTKVTTPEGISVTTVFSRHGQTQLITDGKNQPTKYAYDRNGNLVTTTTLLKTERQAFDRANRLIETTDGRGVKTLYGYDPANRVLTTRVDPTGLNITTTYAYDAKGQKVSVTQVSANDARGTVTTIAYDLKGRVLSQTVDPAGLNLKTSYGYDAKGRVLTVTDPATTVTKYTYDRLGRRTGEQVDPTGLNLTRSYGYDKNGNVVWSVDGNNVTTRYAYDKNDRLVYTVDGAGGTSQNVYDAEGRLTRSVRYAAAINLTGLPVVVTGPRCRLSWWPPRARTPSRRAATTATTACASPSTAAARWSRTATTPTATSSTASPTPTRSTWQPGTARPTRW